MESVMMGSLGFEEVQRKRILSRITACREAIRSNRVDARFKATVILPSQLAALVRIEQGLYGQCIGCPRRIERRRLQKVPAALRCISCQKNHEL